MCTFYILYSQTKDRGSGIRFKICGVNKISEILPLSSANEPVAPSTCSIYKLSICNAIRCSTSSKSGWEGGKVRSKTWAKSPDLVLFDEVHRAQNRNSKTHKTLKQVTGGFKLAMSGTPTGNKFEGAWAVTRWLWPDEITNSFHIWVTRWCSTEYDHFAPGNRKVVGEKEPGAFFNWLPCYVRIESELDVSLDEEIRYVELSAVQRKAYDQLEKSMITWVEGNPLVVEFPITLRARLRQASLGMFSVDEAGESRLIWIVSRARLMLCWRFCVMTGRVSLRLS